MDVDGCGWVRWDVGAIGRCKNKTNRHKNGGTGHDLGTLVGEISPNIMFCKKTGKNAGLALNGCAWVRIGWLGPTHVKKSKNERKIGTNGLE